MRINVIVEYYIKNIRPKKGLDELNWFKNQPTLQSAIEYAALAINCKGKRYSHQRRLTRKSLEQARQILLSNFEAIENTKNFDDLISLLEILLEPVKGIGELYVYDTSLRIGTKLGLMPEFVYLHAGTRAGAKVFGISGKTSKIKVSVLPSEFLPLEPFEVEDVLCVFKDKLKKIVIQDKGV